MKSLSKNMLALAVAAVVAGPVAAYETGDWVLRAGYAAVHPNEDDNGLHVNGTKLDGTGVGLNNNAQLGLTGSYIFAPHWGIEVLAATPFKHEITVKGLGGIGIPDGTKLGTAKHLPPTVSAQYYFMDANSEWQPYAGLGINYTLFFDESLDSGAKSALGASNLHLKDSVGLAAEVGLDWRINKSWLLNVSAWRAQIKTDASVDTALGKVTTKVTIDPWVYMLAVGYKF